MGFLDDFDFGSLADLFEGAGEGMVNDGPSLDLGGAGAATAAPDLGTFAWDSAGADLGGANPATFFSPSGSPAPLSGSGYEPNGGAATIGGQAPVSQGSSAPSTPFGESEGEGGTGRSAVDADAPYHPAAPGAQQQPPSSAWESVRNAPGKWWQSVGNEFEKNPISSTAKVGALAAPFIGAGLGAMTAPAQPKPFKPVSPVANAQTEVPVASPMSTTLTGQGGFKVRA